MTVRFVLAKIAPHIRGVLVGTTLRFAVVFPICLYAYTSTIVALNCSHHWTNFCIVIIAMAPFVYILGPIAHDEEDPPSHYPPVLLAAALVTIAWMLAA
jgi:hypothetical protein